VGPEVPRPYSLTDRSSRDAHDVDPTSNPSVAAMVVAGGIVAAATATLGPAGAVTAAVLSPMAAELLEKAAAEWRREGERRAGVALSEALLTAHASIEEFLNTIGSDPARLNLLAETIDAAARSNLDAKVRMLGAALGSGALAQDAARVDEAALKVRVLGELEAPHLKVLDAIDKGSRHVQGEWTGASEAALVDTVGDGTGPRSRPLSGTRSPRRLVSATFRRTHRAATQGCGPGASRREGAAGHYESAGRNRRRHPKSRKSVRRVSFPRSLTPAIEQHLALVGDDPNSLLFSSVRDPQKPLSQSTFHRHFDRARKSAGRPVSTRGPMRQTHTPRSNG
jgi:hypothetical protein